MQQMSTLYSKLVSSLDGIVWEADGETFQFTYVSPQAGWILVIRSGNGSSLTSGATTRT